MSPNEINESKDPQSYKDARTFRDANGVQWFVHEVGGDALGGGPVCLLLVSNQQVRRVLRFPTDWRSLPVTALLDLPYSGL